MSKKQVVYLYRGCSGSGKSKAAQELRSCGFKFVEINRDNVRFDLFTNGVHDWSKYKFTKERENKVTETCAAQSNCAARSLVPIVISNTNLKQKDVDYWEAKAKEFGYDFEVQYFPATLTELLKRDKKRGALSVGQDIIFDQWQKWLEITGFKKYEPDETKPKAIILDIDGTVALVNGRSHYDYSEAVLTDRPRLDVIEMVSAYASVTGAEIICVSGRDDCCKDYTQQWLDTYCIDNLSLHMRKTGDERCDTIIKEEIFREFIEPHYNVIAAFDDRKRVVRKWTDLGIPMVVDVCKTYKEF